MNSPRILLIALLAGAAACSRATPVGPDAQRTPDAAPRHNGSTAADTVVAPDGKGSVMPVVSHPGTPAPAPGAGTPNAPTGKGSTIPVV